MTWSLDEIQNLEGKKWSVLSYCLKWKGEKNHTWLNILPFIWTVWHLKAKLLWNVGWSASNFIVVEAEVFDLCSFNFFKSLTHFVIFIFWTECNEVGIEDNHCSGENFRKLDWRPDDWASEICVCPEYSFTSSHFMLHLTNLTHKCFFAAKTHSQWQGWKSRNFCSLINCHFILKALSDVIHY